MTDGSKQATNGTTHLGASRGRAGTQPETPTFSATLAPHSLEAEEAVLGSILINPEAFHEVAAFLSPDNFFLLRNEWIFEAMVQLVQRGEPIEYVTIIEELKTQGRLADIGGAAYITYLIGNTYTSTNAEAYGRIVARTAGRRRWLVFAEKVTEIANDEGRDYPSIEKAIEAEYLLSVETNAKITKDKTKPRRLSEIAIEVRDNMQARLKDTTPKGVDTGLSDIDSRVGMFQPGDFVLWGFDTGGGKSVMGISVTKYNTAIGKRGFYLSLEMTSAQHLQRYTATYTGISAKRQRTLELTPEEIDRLMNEYARIGQDKDARRVFVDERSDISTYELRSAIKYVVRELGQVDYIFIDHINLLNPPGFVKNDAAPRMKYIAEECKKIAKDFGTVVHGLVQFRNDIPMEATKRPTISHLYGGAAVKQAADVIFIGHRPEMYLDEAEFSKPDVRAKYENLVDIYCDKFREGESGWKASLTFLKERTLFVNRAK